MSLQRAVQEIEDNNLEIVRFEISDFYGISHSKSIPARHFTAKASTGVPFFFGHLSYDPQGGSATGTSYREKMKYGDAVYYPDLETFRRVPWAQETARVITFPMYQGEIVKGYPRTVAEKLLEEMKEMGLSLYSSHEHEFFVFDAETKKPITDGVQVRATIRLAKHNDFIMQIAKQLPIMGVDLESIETEYAPGQFEISYKPVFGLQAADNAFTYKNGIKEIAQSHGFLASFVTKPFADQSGSSAHFNHSLWDVTGRKCLTFDANSPYGLSKVFEHWMAGILYHAPAIAVLMSPTVNCLTRYKEHDFAPGNVTWGIDNRSTALRVKINGENGTYVENRMGAAGGCPYTSLAATVAAGMDGIRNRYPLPPPVEGIAYDEADIPPGTINLPVDMKTALEELLNDAVICDAFGEEFIECFVALKTHEAKLEAAAIENGMDHSEWARSFYSDYM